MKTSLSAIQLAHLAEEAGVEPGPQLDAIIEHLERERRRAAVEAACREARAARVVERAEELVREVQDLLSRSRRETLAACERRLKQMARGTR